MITQRRIFGLLLCSLAVLAWTVDTGYAQSRRGSTGSKSKKKDKGGDKEGAEAGDGEDAATQTGLDDGAAPTKKKGPRGASTTGGKAAQGSDDGDAPKKRTGPKGAAPAGGKKQAEGSEGASEESKAGDGKEGDSKEDSKSEGGIVWRSTLQEAIKDATNAGKPILADFWATWCGPCKMLDKNTFPDPELIAYVNKNFIPVKIDVDKNVSQSKEYKIEAMPSTVIMGPNGKMIDKFVGYRDAKSYLAELKKMMAKVGDFAAGSSKAKKLLDDANSNLGNGKYAVAIGQLRQILEKHRDTAEGKTAADKLKDVEEIAMGKLKTLKESAQKGDFVEMAKLSTELQDVFAGTQAAREAKDIQISLATNKDAQKQIRVAQVKQTLDQVQLDLKANKYAIAFDRLKQVQKEYPDQPRFVEEAKWQYDLLQKNPVAVRKARDEVAVGQCKIWLSFARTWKGNNNMVRASEYYRKVIDTFPGTTFAETAERELSRGG